LIHFSGYTECELEECVSLVLNFLGTSLIKKYESIYKKYSQRKFMKAAIFAQDWVNKAMELGMAIMGGAVQVGKHFEDSVSDDEE
jgi:Cyclin, C-terminal domain